MYIDFIANYKVKAKILRRKGGRERGREGERIIKSVVFRSEVYAKAKRETARFLASKLK